MGPRENVFKNNSPPELMDQLCQSDPPDLGKQLFRRPVPREIDDERSPFDSVQMDESPKATVLAIVSIIP